MNRMEQEHYSFGPWLIEVKDEKNLPSQYDDYKEDILSAELIIKVPINEDRKDVSPGIVLYKEVFVVKDRQVIIYAYTDKGIAIRSIDFEDIVYIIRGGELLFNYIAIGTACQEYRIDYYSVSQELTAKFIELVRKDMIERASKLAIGTVITSEYDGLKLFRYFNHKELISEDVEILAYQEEVKLTIAADNWQDRLVNSFKSEKLDEILFMTNGSEIIVISGDIDSERSASVDYSYRHCYIKVDDIQEITLMEDERYENSRLLNIDLGDNKLLFRVGIGFEVSLIKEHLNKI